MKVVPLNDKIVVKRLEAEDKTAGGIVLPDTAKEKPQRGRVLAVGPGPRDEDGNHITMDVAEGDEVEPGAVICIVEAMKMENELTAPRAGVVTGLAVAAGDAVAFGQTICVVSPADPG